MGAKGAMPPRCQKLPFLPSICSALLCAVKLIKFIPTICIFGSFYAPKTFASGAAPRTGPLVSCKSISMAVLVFQVYFYTVLVIEKNEI